MTSYLSIKQNLDILMEMLEKGELLSLKQAAQLFDCTEATITSRLNYLRESGHKIQYSRSAHKFVLIKRKRSRKRMGDK